MAMFLFSIVKAVVSLLRHYAVSVNHIEHIREASALSEVDFAICADILLSLVDIAMAHCEHLGEVKFRLSFAQKVFFKERSA